jgi:hypothetical protein
LRPDPEPALDLGHRLLEPAAQRVEIVVDGGLAQT